MRRASPAKPQAATGWRSLPTRKPRGAASTAEPGRRPRARACCCLFPPEHLRRPAILTAWAAVAVCRTVQKTVGIQARIKWPNDVLLRGKKVCGILIEQGRWTVVGIGLNVQQTAADFAAAALPQAASLAQFSPHALVTSTVARELLVQLDEQFAALLDGDFATLEACWKWHVGVLGRPVAAECHDGVVRGRLRDLTFGGLELERADGTTQILWPENVLHLDRESRGGRNSTMN